MPVGCLLSARQSFLLRLLYSVFCILYPVSSPRARSLSSGIQLAAGTAETPDQSSGILNRGLCPVSQATIRARRGAGCGSWGSPFSWTFFRSSIPGARFQGGRPDLGLFQASHLCRSGGHPFSSSQCGCSAPNPGPGTCSGSQGSLKGNLPCSQTRRLSLFDCSSRMARTPATL